MPWLLQSNPDGSITSSPKIKANPGASNLHKRKTPGLVAFITSALLDCYETRNDLPGAAKQPRRPFYPPDEGGIGE